MSRISKNPIEIPAGVTVSVVDHTVTVKGPKGELVRTFHPKIAIAMEGNTVILTKKGEDVFVRSLWGTVGSHIKNMMAGVVTPYEKKLILEGVGFKSAVAGKSLDLALGFSHPVKIEIPEGLTVTADKNVISISGIDKEAVGQFSAYVRSQKKPEPYKGKGFRYDDEVIRRKQGKKSA
ncbi:MAG: ribosomal protein large subunit ribosomal protein [Patescibacteria group bacterium]|nr:ribosomal protein large subunit ribosomal protein [Patescibacteria group bacterium]